MSEIGNGDLNPDLTELANITFPASVNCPAVPGNFIAMSESDKLNMRFKFCPPRIDVVMLSDCKIPWSQSGAVAEPP